MATERAARQDDGTGRGLPSKQPGGSGSSEAQDAAQAASFNLLRQLQSAVRSIILTATVGSSCVRCSDRLCVQLFRLIRSCLLAGCRRFAGADTATDDLLFLLIVPEFIGAFDCDLDFVAYVCIGHAAASFAQQLFEDEARTKHFYFDCAIMRDEELHLAFVSSLLALEPVDFLPDSPQLAQRCRSAALEDLRLSPVLWTSRRRPHSSTSGGQAHPAALPQAGPDSQAPLPDLLMPAESVKSSAGIFAQFIGARRFRGGKKQPVALPAPAVVAGRAEGGGSSPRRRSPTCRGVDVSLGALATGAMSQDEGASAPACTPSGSEADAEGSDDDVPSKSAQGRKRTTGEKALLRGHLVSAAPSLVLEAATEPPLRGSEERSEVAAEDEAALLRFSAGAGGDDCGFEAAWPELGRHLSWSAADFTAPLGDAFGLDVSAVVLEVPEAALSLRDLAITLTKEKKACRGLASRRPPPAQLALLQGRGAPRLCHSNRQACAQLFAAAGAPESLQAGPARWDADGEEADDAVAALEGLWEASRKDSVHRLMKHIGAGLAAPGGAGGAAAALSPLHGSSRAAALDHLGLGTPPPPLHGFAAHGRGQHDGSSAGGGSSASSTVATPRGSSVSLHARLSGGQDDGLSDTESEHSSGHHSVSTTSVLGQSVANGEGVVASTSPFGVHLEWRLRLSQRLPQAEQISLQKGLCPGCMEPLPTATLLTAPRYCHYLCCLFCHDCHHGDLRVIPARVAERWDFEPRKVCRMAAKYLEMQAGQPLIPITRVRRTRVPSQAVLTQVHMLRQKLVRIREVLAEQGCEFLGFLDLMLSELDPHIAGGPDLYSLRDLMRVALHGRDWSTHGKLLQAMAMGADHVRECPTCQSCAQLCPICAAGAPIFAFEVDRCIRCSGCRRIYHLACFRLAGSQCPFCVCAQATSSRRPSLSSTRAR